MKRTISTATLLFCWALLLGACASGGGSTDEGAASSSSAPAAKTSAAPPAGTKLAQVEPGMTDAQVREVMGEPDSSNSYQTGKAWIPYYYGGDTARTDYVYEGQGRVVFTRNRWSGSLKVIDVAYDPNAGS